MSAVDLWDLLQQKRAGTQVSTKKIIRLMKITGKMTAFNKLIPSIENNKKRQAMATYKKLKKECSYSLGTVWTKADESSSKGRQDRQAFGQRAESSSLTGY
jgi:hypothetical protein